jgi:hypothetical protein
MRDLTLLETGYLASLLLASMVLPVLLSVLAPIGRTKILSTRIVWAGQLILSGAALTLLLLPTATLFAAAFGVVVVMICASALLCLRTKPMPAKAR